MRPNMPMPAARAHNSRRAPLASICTVLCLLSIGGVARAADSDAPPGAPSYWLPSAPWVQSRWLPYREADLERIMRISRSDLSRWLTDHRGLTDLARRRGLRVSTVINELMAPWAHRVPRAQLRVLYIHAEKTFTQDHLAVHMFFHTMHLQGVNALLPEVLKIDYRQMAALRAQGRSWYEIAAREGVHAVQVRSRFVAMLKASARRGVVEQQTLPDQEAASLSFQLSNLPIWLSFAPPVRLATRFATAVEGLALECHLLSGG